MRDKLRQTLSDVGDNHAQSTPRPKIDCENKDPQGPPATNGGRKSKAESKVARVERNLPS